MADHPLDAGNGVPRLALRPKEAAKALGIGERKLAELIADRDSGLPVVRLNKIVLVPCRELADFLTARIEKPRGHIEATARPKSGRMP